MRLVLAALVASTGCAQVFGLDETTGMDASTASASVQIQKVSIGATVIKAPLDVSNEMATFYDDRAGTLAPIPGVQSAIDTFSAEAVGTPSAIYTVPDAQVPTRMLALPSAMMRANYVELEHPGAQEPLPSSSFMLDITLPSVHVSAPAETFSVQAVGAWMSRALTTGDGVPAPDVNVNKIMGSVPYSAFALMVPGNPRARITMADVVLVLRYTVNTLSGVFQSGAFDQTDGVDTLAGTMIAVPANTQVTAAIDPPSFATRFAAARPGVSGNSMSWRINAAPGYAVGSDNGVRLINDTVAAIDTTINAMYGNPFESLDWKAVLTFGASAARNYSYMESAMTVNVPLAASMVTVTEPSTTLNLTMPAGLPITVTANELALVTDGQMLPLDLANPIDVKATVDRPTNTAYELFLTELSIDSTGPAPVLARKVVIDLVTTGGPQFRLPPSLFTVGKTYYITVRAYQGGFVNAAAGDVQTFTLPISYASLDSAVFTVGMP